MNTKDGWNHFTSLQARKPKRSTHQNHADVGSPVFSPLPPSKIEVLDTFIYLSLRGQCGTCVAIVISSRHLTEMLTGPKLFS